LSGSEETLIPPGTKLAHYEIRRLLGTGAMGTVYEANDEALDRSVAV
jgi:serine/threonine protein kinase